MSPTLQERLALAHPLSDVAVAARMRIAGNVGGTIVIDDCHEGGRWGGAYEAFIEFAKAKGLDATITDGNLGLITKPAPVV